ncbi:MAG: radical SAM family heme chaperone HemW [Candidatus Limnocylindrales bacterium]
MSAAPVALYVHFPFCLSLCPYCDFVVYAGRDARGPNNRIGAFVDAVVAEIGLRARPSAVHSVYLGGGTPSLMAAADVERILTAADAAFGIAARAEITIESNPGPAERGDLRGFRAAGVNRVSFGAQSLNIDELRALGRRHAPADVTSAVTAARKAGFHNVSVDLLYDVPGQSLDSWRSTLDAAIALEPEHVSAYGLNLDGTDPDDGHMPVSRGAAQWRTRARAGQDEDRAADMYEQADEALGRAGLHWYEISNWSRPGHESVHNQVYWRGDSWEAVGPGAHRFDGATERSWNSARLDAYVGALGRGDLPPGQTAAAEQWERTMLGLRTSAGVPADLVGDTASWGIEHGLLEQQSDALRLTVRGRLMSNVLFERLLPAD